VKEAQPVWQEGIGSLLRLSAAHQTGLLGKLLTSIMGLADPMLPGLTSLHSAIVEGLVRTLLFLPVAGLERTWDLRG
jgi:hypothetical protein